MAAASVHRRRSGPEKGLDARGDILGEMRTTTSRHGRLDLLVHLYVSMVTATTDDLLACLGLSPLFVPPLTENLGDLRCARKRLAMVKPQKICRNWGNVKMLWKV
jgi:hypothetical protein